MYQQNFYTRTASNQNVMYLKVHQNANNLTQINTYKRKKQQKQKQNLVQVKLNSPFQDQKEKATTKMLANHR